MAGFGKRLVARRVINLEIAAFALVIVTIWLDEALDLPHVLLGAAATPLNWQESLIESITVAALGVAIVRVTALLFARMRHLEGILPICAGCKQIRDEQGEWHAVEAYVRDRTEAEFSHGICPECARRLYPDLDLEPSNRSAPNGAARPLGDRAGDLNQ